MAVWVKDVSVPVLPEFSCMIIFRKIPPYLIRELSNSESHDPKWTRQLGVCVLEFVDKYIETVDVENGISNT